MTNDSLRFIDFALTKGLYYKDISNEQAKEIRTLKLINILTERERDSLISLINKKVVEIEKIDWKLTGLLTAWGVIIGIVGGVLLINLTTNK